MRRLSGFLAILALSVSPAFACDGCGDARETGDGWTAARDDPSADTTAKFDVRDSSANDVETQTDVSVFDTGETDDLDSSPDHEAYDGTGTDGEVGCTARGESCAADTECCGGATCISGTCGRTCGESGESCSSDGDCCDPLVCDEGTCQAGGCKNLYESCTEGEEECCSGARCCIDGMCQCE